MTATINSTTCFKERRKHRIFNIFIFSTQWREGECVRFPSVCALCVCVCNWDESEREHLIYLPDCCVTMITPNGCHYNKWPDYCNSVWKTYWRPNKPALNGTPLRLTLWHVHERLWRRALTEQVAEELILISFLDASFIMIVTQSDLIRALCLSVFMDGANLHTL